VKITTAQLRQILKEEIERELNPVEEGVLDYFGLGKKQELLKKEQLTDKEAADFLLSDEAYAQYRNEMDFEYVVVTVHQLRTAMLKDPEWDTNWKTILPTLDEYNTFEGFLTHCGRLLHTAIRAKLSGDEAEAKRLRREVKDNVFHLNREWNKFKYGKGK